jgi:hypothetical protein
VNAPTIAATAPTASAPPAASRPCSRSIDRATPAPPTIRVASQTGAARLGAHGILSPMSSIAAIK